MYRPRRRREEEGEKEYPSYSETIRGMCDEINTSLIHWFCWPCYCVLPDQVPDGQATENSVVRRKIQEFARDPEKVCVNITRQMFVQYDILILWLLIWFLVKKKYIYKMCCSCNPPCVPYLGMYLTDLAFIEEGTPNFTAEGLVNFSKMRMVNVLPIPAKGFNTVKHRPCFIAWVQHSWTYKCTGQSLMQDNRFKEHEVIHKLLNIWFVVFSLSSSRSPTLSERSASFSRPPTG